MENNIVDLLVEMKQAAIDNLLRGHPTDNLDEPYMTERVLGGRSWSRRQLAEEIENNTDVGIKILRGMVYMATDLWRRNKISISNG